MRNTAGLYPLVTQRLGPRLVGRYHRTLPSEAFEGPRSVEDLPLYRLARRIFKRVRRLRGRDFPRRMVEPPPGLDSRLAHKTPQFFLRNIPRVERFVEDQPKFHVVKVRDVESERVVQRLRELRYEPPDFLTEWNLERVKDLRILLRHLLFEEDWSRRFGREVKERIRGPLFRYDPDAPAHEPERT